MILRTISIASLALMLLLACTKHLNKTVITKDFVDNSLTQTRHLSTSSSKFQDADISTERELAAATEAGRYHEKLKNLNQDDIMYYNLKKELNSTTNQEQHQLVNILDVYPKSGPCIITLVPNNEKDLKELKRALRSLKFLKGDANSKYPAPILIFNENDLSEEIKLELVNSTNRPVAFPTVDFSEFPPGFDPEEEKVEFKVKGRQEWGYYQMIRFWVTGMWMHPALVPFENIMRIDSDSCFMEPNPTLPNFPSKQAVYHSQYVGLEPRKEFTKGLWDWNIKWLKSQNNKSSGNPMFWSYAKNTHELEQTLPLYRTNFELSKKSFMQKRDVYKWNEAITEQEPFGVYRHRWGDAVIRFLMTAIFPQSEMVITSRPKGYAHKNLCDPVEYAKRFKMDLDTLKNTIEALEQ